MAVDRPAARLAAARERAFADADDLVLVPPDGRERVVHAAIGDPQAPLDVFLGILERHGLLGDDGRVPPDVALGSEGVHFDWGTAAQREQATRGGLAGLAGRAAHPPDQVRIVLRNHALPRGGELAGFDDDGFSRARAEADLAYRGGDVDRGLEAALLARWPAAPSAEVLARDLSCFSAAQRALVTRLLRARRARLAHAFDDGLLLLHAGVTTAELGPLGAADGDAHAIAAALGEFLDARVDAWTGAGPLDLAPLHGDGSARGGGAEGMVVHRPAQAGADRVKRRFDPRALPRGVAQVVGHIHDRKCRELLPTWADAAPPVHGRLRSLSLAGAAPRYRVGCDPDAALYFVDGAMNRGAPAAYELFDLRRRGPLTPRAPG